MKLFSPSALRSCALYSSIVRCSFLGSARIKKASFFYIFELNVNFLKVMERIQI